MLKFSAEHIRATGASYSPRWGPLGFASITVKLAPFEFDGQTHVTSLRCDQIQLDLDDFAALAERRFTFPPNPEPGYIDGSIYLFGRHVVFITGTLSFGAISAETIPLKIDGTLEFTTSGFSQHEDATLSIETALHLPLTPERIASIADEAITAVGARSPRDIGKVMTLLGKDSRADGWMAELNVEARRQLQSRSLPGNAS